MSPRFPHSAGPGRSAPRGARRWPVAGTIATAVLLVGAGLGVAAAETGAPVSAVSCPSVADKLPAVPAAAQAEVSRNLALLDTQVAEANRRLAGSRGEGGPNFINNAVLGPLASKRAAAIDRIAIAIGRQADKPRGLGSLAACSLKTSGAGAAQGGAAPARSNPAPPAPPVRPGGAVGAAPTVSCPSVADKLPAVPAAAQAEVSRNLALLDTQVAEANRRLVTSRGQGGPNFIDNAVLRPLASKRTAAIDRIAIAIGRQADKPRGLESLAACSLNSAGR